jgi:serine protease Do
MKPTINLSRAAALAIGLVVAAAGELALVAPASAQGVQGAPRIASRFVQMIGSGGVRLGITIRDVTEADVTAENLSGPSGAYVQQVRPDGPAATAGFESGDIVLTFDGERVRGSTQLVRLVAETPAGREVEATVQRDGAPVTLRVTLEAPDRRVIEDRRVVVPGARVVPGIGDYEFRMPDFTAPGLPGLMIGTGRLGVTVQELTDQLGTYFGASNGVLVTSVREDSPAEAAGLRAGDVITAVGGESVDAVADLRRQVAEASGELAITIVRDRQEQTVTARFEEPQPLRPGTSL